MNEEFHNMLEGRNVPKPQKMLKEEEMQKK